MSLRPGYNNPMMSY